MFDEDKLPKRTLRPHQGCESPIPYWVTCAHGTPVEALYSIVSGWNTEGGGLRASEDESSGHRYNGSAKGVYLHRWEQNHLAADYSQFCPLFSDS
eukprot:7698722-Karenia_brevis.AAC.1